MKDSDRIFFLMGKELSHTITPAEAEELKALLAADPELWYAYEQIQAVNSMDDVTREYVQEIRSLLDGKIEPEKLNTLLLIKPEEAAAGTPSAIPSKYPSLLRVAAALGGIIVMTLASIALFRQGARHKVHTEIAMSEIVAPKGAKTHVVLADGTAIWLNAGSKLRYPKNFSLEHREVFLAGEAYFEVPHDDEHSFIVHTPEATIRDLGTTFNVKAYTGSAVTEATLIEGAIEVSLEKDPVRKIRMSPGEKLVLHNKPAEAPARQQPEAPVPVFEVSKIVPYAKTNDIVETAWVTDKLIFRNERFEDLAQMMERRYNVSIVIKDEVVKNYRLTGIFKDENITEALKLLQVIVPFKVKMNNGQVIINK
jgi:ferric-dicitrate binding protein FerR (iron transport regulator)